MGIGSSQEYYQTSPRRPSPASRYGSHGKKKRRRGLFRRAKPPPTAPIRSVRRYPPHQYPYRSRPLIPPLLPPVPTRYMPIPYNNYSAFPYAFPAQPFVMPSRQVPPMLIPPQQFSPMAMPQQLLQPPLMPMPYHLLQPPPMAMPGLVSPSIFSPYQSSPYSMGVPFSTPYTPQQAQVPPMYNNIGVSAPVSTGMSNPTGFYSSPYQPASRKLSTDWTGGGVISPGFLGPPI